MAARKSPAPARRRNKPEASRAQPRSGAEDIKNYEQSLARDALAALTIDALQKPTARDQRPVGQRLAAMVVGTTGLEMDLDLSDLGLGAADYRRATGDSSGGPVPTGGDVEDDLAPVGHRRPHRLGRSGLSSAGSRIDTPSQSATARSDCLPVSMILPSRGSKVPTTVRASRGTTLAATVG